MPHPPSSPHHPNDPNTPPPTDDALLGSATGTASPGVYIRLPGAEAKRGLSPDQHDMLDALWATATKTLHGKEEKHPVLMFIAGLGVGVFVTLMAFTVFISKPAQVAVAPNGPLTQPVEALQGAISRGEDPAVAERDLLLNDTDTPAEATINTPGQSKPQGGGFSFNFGQPKAQEATPPKAQPSEADELAPTPAAQANVYEVQAGDTLSTIAQRFYSSSHPDMVDKIQRANNMTNAHSLSLGQKLVIPPKDYR
jgi:hypothetical protein